MSLNTVLYENSRPSGIGILEVVNPEGRGRLFVPLRKSHLSGEFQGPLGSLFLEQEFGFSKEELDRTIEAVYRFPLPGDAAVKKVTATIGDQVIETSLKERETAKKEYNKAFSEGRSGALLTRESADVFTLRITGIAPGMDVRVATEFVLLARSEGKGWSVHFPLTIGPRFVRSDEDHPGIHGQPLLPSIDPHHRFSLELSLQEAGPVMSPSHSIESEEENGVVKIRLKDGPIIPDRDLVLSWKPRTSISDCHITTWVEGDDGSDDEFFLALVAPPEMPAVPAIPREAILILDRSGSMSGEKWECVQKAAASFLDTLRPEDSFNVCLFNDETAWYNAGGVDINPVSVAALPAHVERVKRFISQTRADGATNLGIALEQGLSLPRDTTERSRHILLFTDGQVSDDARIVRIVEQESRKTDRRRINVICIDTAPNSYLVREIARIGGGMARFVSTRGNVSNLRESLEEILFSWQQPVYLNARLLVNRPWIEAAARTGHPEANGVASVDIGDLAAGSPVFIAGRLPKSPYAPIFTLLTAEEDLIQASSPRPVSQSNRGSAKTLFGSERIQVLEHLLHSGYSEVDLASRLSRMHYQPPGEQEKRMVYPENRRPEMRDYIRKTLIKESLRFGIPSTETAFVGVAHKAGEKVSASVLVPNALPAGWSDDFLGCHEELKMIIMQPNGTLRQGHRKTYECILGSSFLKKSPGGDESTIMLQDRPSLPGKRRKTDDLVSRSMIRESPPGESAERRLPGGMRPVPGEALKNTEILTGRSAVSPPLEPLPVFRHKKYRTETIAFTPGNEESTTIFDSEQLLKDAVYLCGISLENPGEPCDKDTTILILQRGISDPKYKIRALDLCSGGIYPIDIWLDKNSRVIILWKDPSGKWSGKEIHVLLHYMKMGEMVVA